MSDAIWARPLPRRCPSGDDIRLPSRKDKPEALKSIGGIFTFHGPSLYAWPKN
jgi:hypothetical protein